MINTAGITSYVSLRSNRLQLNEQSIFEKDEMSMADFLPAAYEALQINYPKFYKMDNLCKTGFLGAELLLKNAALKEKYKPEEVGIVISCANASLDTDLRYEATPGPALFVYTLPNILIGEIAIRNGIKGESACFVFDIFDAPFQTNYINNLFETGKIKACISGWADFLNDKAEAFFYLTETNQTNNNPAHDSDSVSKIFTEAWKS
ncbi:MAG: hypothetical protein KIS94_01400 [Chitinophagales bacterium]|nr:hypothetical protein [Chitinophagales bacterium]